MPIFGLGQEMKKQEVLTQMTFGHRVAEEEVDELSEYFVETDQWRQVFSGAVDVIYGPKGSGKSALYSLLQTRERALRARNVVLAPAENPRGATAFRDLVADPPTSEVEFVRLWKLYFASILTDVLERNDVSGEKSDQVRAALESAGLVRRDRSLKSLLRAVLDYVRLVKPAGIEAGLELDPHSGLPSGFKGKVTFQEPSATARTAGFLSVDQILQWTDESIRTKELSVWILLDRLDVAFAESQALEQSALRALFKVYLDILEFRNIKLKIFLRTDIWKRLTADGFREASHITRALTIKWERATLLNLVVRRAIRNKCVQEFFALTPAAALASTGSQASLFTRMFPEQVDVGPNRPETLDWMIGRCRDGTGQAAPRELIHLLNCLRDVQVRKLEIGEAEPDGETLFARSSFKEALKEVSRTRLEQTLYAEYPRLKPWIEGLRGEKTLQTADTLARLWRLSPADSATTAQELVDIGFFEIRGEKEAPAYWVPFLFRDCLDLVQGSAEA